MGKVFCVIKNLYTTAKIGNTKVLSLTSCIKKPYLALQCIKVAYNQINAGLHKFKVEVYKIYTLYKYKINVS